MKGLALDACATKTRRLRGDARRRTVASTACSRRSVPPSARPRGARSAARSRRRAAVRSPVRSCTRPRRTADISRARPPTRPAPTYCTCPRAMRCSRRRSRAGPCPPRRPRRPPSATVDLTLPKRATLAIDVKSADAAAEPLPARVQVIPSVAIARPPAAFGVADVEADGRLWNDFAITGHLDLPVPPGQHRVVVTRGYEYELYDAPATATVGTTTNVTASLLRSVDSTRRDVRRLPHPFALLRRLRRRAGAQGARGDRRRPRDPGLERARMGHRFPADHPEARPHEVGVRHSVRGAHDLHVGPLRRRPALPEARRREQRRGRLGRQEARRVLPHRQRAPGEAGAHRQPSEQLRLHRVLRVGSLRPHEGLGRPRPLERRVRRDRGLQRQRLREESRQASVGDWFALLNAGKTYWATGSSDSHHERTSPVGYPRTCLRFGHDDPTKLTRGERPRRAPRRRRDDQRRAHDDGRGSWRRRSGRHGDEGRSTR